MEQIVELTEVHDKLYASEGRVVSSEQPKSTAIFHFFFQHFEKAFNEDNRVSFTENRSTSNFAQQIREKLPHYALDLIDQLKPEELAYFAGFADRYLTAQEGNADYYVFQTGDGSLKPEARKLILPEERKAYISGSRTLLAEYGKQIKRDPHNMFAKMRLVSQSLQAFGMQAPDRGVVNAIISKGK